MATIRHTTSQKTAVLEPDHTIGRAPQNSLQLVERYVSSRHASLRWTGQDWLVKDLGSRNGTFLDGTRLVPGRDYVVPRLSRIAFGRSAQEWEMSDSTAPSVMMLPLNGGSPVLAEGDLLALPNAETAHATAYRAPDFSWVLEIPDAPLQALAHMQTVVVAGIEYRFCCDPRLELTSIAEEAGAALELSLLTLRFTVSSDEEHVALTLGSRTGEIQAGSRRHNYLLLTLARARLEDRRTGIAEAECGWVYRDDLARDPSMAPPQLNVDVFRIRKQLAALGVPDATRIVECRSDTHQVRIGCPNLVVARV